MSNLRIALLGTFLTTALLSTALACGQCRYEVTIIQMPEGACSTPDRVRGLGVNDDDTVVGYFTCFPSSTARPFRWSRKDGFEALPIETGFAHVRPRDVNNAGVIVGTIGGIIAPSRAFSFADGKYTILPPPGDGLSGGRGVSDSGAVVGTRTVGASRRAFIWSPATGFTDSSIEQSDAWGINSLGDVVGDFGGLLKARAFVWDGRVFNVLEHPPDFDATLARDINDRRQIVGVGFGGPNSDLAEAVMWVDGKVHLMAPAIGKQNFSNALEINNSGTVIGVYAAAGASISSSYVWIDGRAWDLNQLVPDHVRVRDAWDINERGEIVAEGTVSGSSNGVTLLLTPVDRPNSDLNGDCEVDDRDLLRLLSEWTQVDSLYDLDGGGVGFSDLTLLLSDWSD